MRILIDSNILIRREDNRILEPSLQNLLKHLHENKINILIHPASKRELAKDKNAKRRDISLSKLGTYAELKNPPLLGESFTKQIGSPKNNHDLIDNYLLNALFMDAIDFLITEDQGVMKKAKKLKIDDKVLTITEAESYFSTLYKPIEIIYPGALKQIEMYNLNLNDPIFDSLKKDYKGFEEWWKNKSREGRTALAYIQDDGLIGAILILKEEDDVVYSIPPLPKKRRLKICTLKVISNGQKIGELFIRKSIEYAIKSNIQEIYLTHFPQQNDSLIHLIEEYGFVDIAANGKERLYRKELKPPPVDFDPLKISSHYFPYYYDGDEIGKFIVPIQPQYYNRLFEGKQPKQLAIDELSSFIIEQNTIKKAYICRSNTKKIKKGDIVFFYRSQDVKGLVSMGTVEEVYTDLNDKNEVSKIVGKRTVYSLNEIEKIVKKPTMVILFKHHFDFENDKIITLQKLINMHILLNAPQTITKLSQEKYILLHNSFKINNERFTVHKTSFRPKDSKKS